MDAALELRLREIRSRASHWDPLLAHLLVLATRSGLNLQVGIVCVLGSHTVRGVPVGSQVSAELLDGEILHYFRALAAIARAANDDDPQWLENVELLEDKPFFAQIVRDEVSQRAEFFAELDQRELAPTDELLDLPEDLWNKAFVATRPLQAFTLQNASIQGPDGKWESVGTVRVALAHVQSWWTFRLGVPDEAAAHLAEIEAD